jgi:tRNA A37 threonylcarbamoyladenosine biosynthesis protein TsaE
MNSTTASTVNFNQTTSDQSKVLFPIFPQPTQNQKQQQFKESFELAGGANAWVERIERECIEGSAISPALVSLNVQFIEDTGRWEINDRLGQDISRWYEGNLETGEWNRFRNHNYLAAAFFTSENGEIFNAKVANPKENYEKTFKGFGEKPEWKPTGKMRRYEAVKDGGNRIFYPAIDRLTRQLISLMYDIDVPLEGDIWPWILAHPKIPVGITEGAKKALALCSQGFLCIAVLGIANWSVPRTKDPETGETDPNEARILMPELAELAEGGRLIPVWYDQDDTKSHLKAFLNSKREGNLLVNALKVAGAVKETALMWWPAYLGKGIDDVIVKLIKQGGGVAAWIEETIAVSKNAAIYAQIKYLYALSPERPIESSTIGGYLSDHLTIKLEHGKIHAIIAGTGAGKTTLIKQQIKAWIVTGGFVIVITPTNNLGKQLAENVHLPHRHDYVTEDLLQMKAQADGGFVCCLDSLPRLEKHIPKDMPLLVICEEADQVANHATNGKTFQSKYAVTQESFERVLTKAAVVTLAEARIPENTLQYFERLSGKPTRVFLHKLEINKRQVTCYHGQISGFEAMILQYLRCGERILVPSDSQKELDKLERLIRQEMPNLKSMRNDRKTAYLPEIKELNISPNEVLAREQLFFLELSPACKSGISLDGRDDQGNVYEFDRVMGIFLVLPTSEQIQLIARYRPDCPWDIYLAETIQVSGNETVGSPRKLSRQMLEEAQSIAHGWNISYDPSNRSPLEQFTRDHYVVATARAGLEKRINRYSMVQRLIEDGHSVEEVQLSYNKKMADRMKAISYEIDREWGDLVASIQLGDGDTVDLAKKLEQMEAPRPEQTAKAEKIRLVVQHPGVDFNSPEICYFATRQYKAMVRGVDLEAAAQNLEAVGAAQKKATIEQFEASILAVHHFPRKAERAALILGAGILKLTNSDEVFTSFTPEVLELKRTILARAAEWKRNFGFTFEAHQTPISFLTRAAKCLGVKFHVKRAGSGDRLYQYQAYSLGLIDDLLLEAMEKLDLERAKYEGMTEGELDRIVEDKANKSRQQFFRKYGRPPEGFEGEYELFNEVINFDKADPLDVLTADAQESIAKLVTLRCEVEIRKSLLESVLARYAAAASVVPIDGDSNIGNIDGGGICGVEGDRSAPNLATR